jgi:OOP family OmpA-OmpF porin
MNKIIISLVIFFTLLTASAQETVVDTIISKNKLPYNTWSIEANIGRNKAIKPFTEGYSVSGDNRFLNITKINHFDLGVRKMLNYNFGFKFDFASDVIESQDGVTDSKSFQTIQNRIALQGVANVGRLLNFNSFTTRFSLLAHGGVQISKLTGIPKGGWIISENNGGYMLGLSPQFKIANKLVANFDFSLLVNSRQHLTWNGAESPISKNLSGIMNVLSFGLILYLGNEKEHADWYIPIAPKQNPKIQKNLAEFELLKKDIQKSLAEFELLKKDIDGDGVLDRIDLQNNTPKNVAVDSRGRYIDTNSNNIPDELEPKVETDTTYKSEDINLEFGIVDIYFDINKTLPVERSTSVLNNIIKFLKKYPKTKIALTGYADATGNADANIVLANKRAENLKNYIISNGIDSNRMTTSGSGVDKASKVDNETSLKIARRVSITLEQ